MSQERISHIENQLLEELRRYLKRQGRTVGNGIKPDISLLQSPTEKMNEKLSKISPDLNLNSINDDQDVRDFLNTLSEMDRNIFKMRFDDSPISQSQIGHATGLFRQRISQIENQLLEKLRRYLKRQGRAIGNGIKPDINLPQSSTEKMNEKLSKISPDLNLSSITNDRDVRDFLKTLSERDRTILEMRFDDPSISQSKVAYAIGLSRQHISQIENRLLENLRRYLKRQGRTIGNGIKPDISLPQSSTEKMNEKLFKISPELNPNSITHDRDVRDFLKTLSERDRTILEMRFDDPSISQSKVAYAIGLSRQHISQIENRLLENLRRYLKRQGRAIGNGIKPDISLPQSSTEKMNEKLSKISPELNPNSITHDRDVRDFLKTLSERDRNILEMRFEAPPISRSKVGHAIGLSQQHISQIENRLLENLRRYLKRQGRTIGNGIKPAPREKMNEKLSNIVE